MPAKGWYPENQLPEYTWIALKASLRTPPFAAMTIQKIQ
jgi:hypothetical protein